MAIHFAMLAMMTIMGPKSNVFMHIVPQKRSVMSLIVAQMLGWDNE